MNSTRTCFLYKKPLYKKLNTKHSEIQETFGTNFCFALELWNSNIIFLGNLIAQIFTRTSLLNCIIAR